MAAISPAASRPPLPTVSTAAVSRSTYSVNVVPQSPSAACDPGGLRGPSPAGEPHIAEERLRERGGLGVRADRLERALDHAELPDALEEIVQGSRLALGLTGVEGHPARVAGGDPLVDARELLLAVEGGAEVRGGLLDRAALAGAEAQDLARHLLEVLVRVAERGAGVAEQDERRGGDRGTDQALEVALERLGAEHGLELADEVRDPAPAAHAGLDAEHRPAASGRQAELGPAAPGEASLVAAGDVDLGGRDAAAHEGVPEVRLRGHRPRGQAERDQDQREEATRRGHGPSPPAGSAGVTPEIASTGTPSRRKRIVG